MAGKLLTPVLAEHDGENVAYSPVSIAIALAMLRAGVQGESASQLDQLFAVDGARLPSAMNATDRDLESMSGKVGDGDDRKIALSLANALWVQKGLAWNRPFLETLAADYGTGVRALDFEQHPEEARDDINGWVGDQTHDKIPELIPPGMISRDTRLTLTNALYLKAPWTHEFTPLEPGRFTTDGGATVSSARMQQMLDAGYQRGPTWQSVRIPYAGGKLAMTLVVPDAGAMAGVGHELADPDAMATMLAPTQRRSVTLTMPRFDIDTKTTLNDALTSVGVTAPFAPPAGDFAPMSDDPNVGELYVRAVLHQATVTVDEQGTEAAAATAVVVDRSSAQLPVDPVTLVVDRPFYFAITTIDTGVPLFVGRILDPTKS